MRYIKSEKYDQEALKDYIMGPNPMKLLEELLSENPLPPGSTVLDLGCGRGVTSLFLAKECGVRVFAADLWISPSENKKFFDSMGLSSEQIIPIKAEAHELPFADGFFDFVVSVDSYHYFGLDPEYLGKHLLPLIKKGGRLLFAVPGMKKDIHDDIPPELLLSWRPEDLDTLHDAACWRRILSAAEGAEIISLREMESFEECWNDWLACDNEYAVGDRRAMNAGAGKYMNFISAVIGRK
ncbi:MAG: methyltransferase domain-containing protein [Synergistaceae bacterium]|nr:methyltransferase domain-containing protein [Synergistaceae bacterium]